MNALSRIPTAFFLLLSLSTLVHAQDSGTLKSTVLSEPSVLRIEGEVTVIVSSLPFDLVCDAPADLFFWRLPVGWDGAETANRVHVTQAPAGPATVNIQTLAIDWEQKKTNVAGYSLLVNVGKVSPPPGPGPQPPGPGPNPPPTPTPVAGSRTVVVVRETEDATPATLQLIVRLRTGAISTYLKEHQHSLYILDDDSIDETGTKSPFLKPYLEKVGTLPLPAVVIADTKTGAMLFSGPMPATAEEVLELVKKNGG